MMLGVAMRVGKRGGVEERDPALVVTYRDGVFLPFNFSISLSLPSLAGFEWISHRLRRGGINS